MRLNRLIEIVKDLQIILRLIQIDRFIPRGAAKVSGVSASNSSIFVDAFCESWIHSGAFKTVEGLRYPFQSESPHSRPLIEDQSRRESAEIAV